MSDSTLSELPSTAEQLYDELHAAGQEISRHARMIERYGEVFFLTGELSGGLAHKFQGGPDLPSRRAKHVLDMLQTDSDARTALMAVAADALAEAWPLLAAVAAKGAAIVAQLRTAHAMQALDQIDPVMPES